MPRVLIVERDRMARLGLSQVLGSASQIEVVGAVGMVQEAEYLPASTAVDVVLIGEDVPDMDGMDGISRLMTRFVAARVVVLSADSSSANLTAALRHGADGYLPRDISAEALVRAVQGVAQGEVSVPRTMLRGLVEALRGEQVDVTPNMLASLSTRERDVFQEMTWGRSNAEIALRLGLKGSTVKTHVSNILRKTGTRSRFALQPSSRMEQESA